MVFRRYSQHKPEATFPYVWAPASWGSWCIRDAVLLDAINDQILGVLPAFTPLEPRTSRYYLVEILVADLGDVPYGSMDISLIEQRPGSAHLGTIRIRGSFHHLDRQVLLFATQTALARLFGHQLAHKDRIGLDVLPRLSEDEAIALTRYELFPISHFTYDERPDDDEIVDLLADHVLHACSPANSPLADSPALFLLDSPIPQGLLHHAWAQTLDSQRAHKVLVLQQRT